MSDGEGAQSGATEGTQGGAGDTTGTTATGTTGSPETNSTGAGTQSGTAQPTEADTLRAELERQRTRTQAADKRAADNEAKLRQLLDKDLPEVEKLKRDHEAAVQERDKLKESNQQLALQVAFLGDNTVAWHDPQTALKLVDISQVTIGEDGRVSGMKEALTALSKSHPYLVKTDTPPAAKPPATSPANNGGNGTSAPKTGAMASRLPVMRTRFKAQQ